MRTSCSAPRRKYAFAKACLGTERVPANVLLEQRVARIRALVHEGLAACATRISFRLVRGPVPHVTETYELRETSQGTEFTYAGELGADLWRLGEWWADRVAGHWEHAVSVSLERIQLEAE